MADFATRPSFAGHTGRSATTNHELTSTLDHPRGAGQYSNIPAPGIRCLSHSRAWEVESTWDPILQLIWLNSASCECDMFCKS